MVIGTLEYDTFSVYNMHISILQCQYLQFPLSLMVKKKNSNCTGTIN